MEYHGLLNKIILVRPQIDSEKKWTQTQPVDRLGVSPPKMDMIISTIWNPFGYLTVCHGLQETPIDCNRLKS